MKMKQFIQICLVATCLSGPLSAYFHVQELESKMTPDELAQSGIKKLTKKEKQNLETWLIRKHGRYHVSVPIVQSPQKVQWVYKAKQRKPYERFYNSALFDERKIPHNLAIFTLFQHEAPYLKEWIEYHMLQGVEHFYLYNNLSNDNYLKVLQPYIKRGQVTLVQWPYFDPDGASPYHWCEMQKRSYENAMQKARGKYRWMAFIDTDEFLVPMKKDNVVEFLKDYEEYGGVVVNWVIYGTSYVEKILPGELMIDNLVMRAPDTHQDNRKVKSIVKPHRVEWWPSPHYCKYVPGYYAVDPSYNKADPDSQYNENKPINKIRLHHYWYRDAGFYWNVKVERWRKTAWQLTDTEFSWREHEANKVWDPAIRRFVPKLKEQIQAKTKKSTSETTQ